jgi:hypothetical protein
MILQTLDRIRSENARASGYSNGDESSRHLASPGSERQSYRSTDSSVSTPTSARTPTPRFTKRHSNNLFGSGRFRDDTYFRSVAANRSGSQRGAVSVAHSESSIGNGPTSDSDDVRPATPEDNTPSSSVQSSPEKPDSADESVMHTQDPYSDLVASVPEYRLPTAAAYRRASLALQEVIKEIEEEAEDEIVMPRSTPPSRAIVGEQNGAVTDTVSAPRHQCSLSVDLVSFRVIYLRATSSRQEWQYRLTSK